MSELMLPPSVVPNLADWTLLDFSGTAQSPLSGAIRTVSRGQRWQAHYQWANLIQADRNCLSAFMAAVRGKSNRVWISDPTYKQMGSFPAPELLTNGAFKDASGWSGGSQGAVLANNRMLSYTFNGATGGGVSETINLPGGAAYAIRSLIMDGPTTSIFNIGVLFSDSHASYSNVGGARGLITVAGGPMAGGSNNQYVIYATGSANGAVIWTSYASLRRCALVVNPSGFTYYTWIPIDQLPISTAGLLRAGDRCEINGEMKSVTRDLNSDSSGNGTLYFEPALRAIVPDNAPVIIGEPLMRGILTDNPMQVTRPGTYAFSDFDMTFVEG